MILCVGEILVDMIGGEKDGSFCYERKAGGAPFNVACAVKKFGADSGFVGCVGEDTVGSFLEKFVEKQSLTCAYIKKDARVNTTLAFVDLDENGERSFCFYRKNTADYQLPPVPVDIFNKAKIVHIGSLMLSEPIGKKYAVALAKKAKKAGKLVSFDVNFRDDIFRDRQAAVKVYSKMIQLADIVKFSEDEVEIFGQDYVKNALYYKLVCLSLGGAGSRWQYRGQSNQVPTVPVKPIDTTGAGDAFYAGVLSRLVGVDRADWTAETLDSAFRFGNVCGALNTLGKGAIDHLPTIEEIEKKLTEEGR
ncbi:MAG: carbohydrate kinase [Clostridia bacterium]|nr:carbohydrate kinase [Clostridia bacterium]